MPREMQADAISPNQLSPGTVAVLEMTFAETPRVEVPATLLIFPPCALKTLTQVNGYTGYTEWPFTRPALSVDATLGFGGAKTGRSGAVRPFISRANSSRVSDWAPSERARSGHGCTSRIRPSAPMAIAARLAGAISSRRPVPWEG